MWATVATAKGGPVNDPLDDRPRPGRSPLREQAARAFDEISVDEIRELLVRVLDGTATVEERKRLARWGVAGATVLHSIRNILNNSDQWTAEDALHTINMFLGRAELPETANSFLGPPSDADIEIAREIHRKPRGPGAADPTTN